MMTKVVEKHYGHIAEKDVSVKLYTLSNSKGCEVEIITYGGIIRSWRVPDKNGKTVDIILGYDTLEDYLNGRGYLGALVGRVANRIRGGKFSLHNKEYQLAINNGPNHLHGGLKGFSHKVWDSEIVGGGVKLSCSSPAGEEGYPGAVQATVTYELTDENSLILNYSATVTEDSTPINLTNHAYFNLSGEGEPTIGCHKVQILADEYLPVDENCLVTGEIKSVEGTGWDFRTPTLLSSRMGEAACACPGGYDGQLCLVNDGKFKTAAKVWCPRTGLLLEAKTTQPGIQFYTANFLNQIGKGRKSYGKHCSFCLETQGYPDAVNNDNFPSVIVSPGQKYETLTSYTCQVAEALE